MTLTLPSQFEGLPIIASVSGGKDSTALMLALREADIPFRAVFADTGWEAPETYVYLDVLRERIGPIDVVGAPGGMRAIATKKAGFPQRKGRWCTELLKLRPIADFCASVADDVVCAVGVRGEESAKRAAMPETEDSLDLGYFVWRPLLRWTIEDVLAIHHRHGVPVNPLYQRGHGRVGCYPCINAGRDEIRLIANQSPERFDEIEAMERAFSAERVRRNANGEGDFKHTEASFFSARATGMRAGIRDVVAWARAERGGRQLPLLAEPPSGGCFRWGMCEPPADSGDE